LTHNIIGTVTKMMTTVKLRRSLTKQDLMQFGVVCEKFFACNFAFVQKDADHGLDD
jgi:hypothetical protein